MNRYTVHVILDGGDYSQGILVVAANPYQASNTVIERYERDGHFVHVLFTEEGWVER